MITDPVQRSGRFIGWEYTDSIRGSDNGRTERQVTNAQIVEACPLSSGQAETLRAGSVRRPTRYCAAAFSASSAVFVLRDMECKPWASSSAKAE